VLLPRPKLDSVQGAACSQLWGNIKGIFNKAFHYLVQADSRGVGLQLVMDPWARHRLWTPATADQPHTVSGKQVHPSHLKAEPKWKNKQWQGVVCCFGRWLIQWAVAWCQRNKHTMLVCRRQSDINLALTEGGLEVWKNCRGIQRGWPIYFSLLICTNPCYFPMQKAEPFWV